MYAKTILAQRNKIYSEMFPNYAQQLEECTTMKSWEAYLVNQMWRRAGEPKQSPSTFRSLNGVHDTHTWVLCMLKLISSRGTFPLFLFEQMESFLQILYVSNDSLTGTVPTHLGEMTALQFVDYAKRTGSMEGFDGSQC